MYILTFLLIIALSQYITNKILNISDNNSVGYSYSKRDSLIIVIFFGISVLLQYVSKFMPVKIFWLGCAIYGGSIIIVMVVLATIKKVIVEKQRDELEKIFEVLKPALSLKKDEELDVNNPPFELGYEKNQVNRITISIDPNKFKEAVATSLCATLNLYLPNYEWVPEFDFAARKCAFVGTPLPPHVATYKGSWLRPAEFIPIGLSGLGEVSWTLNSIKNEGKSLYKYEDGKTAQTVDTPSAPQCLTVGSPLGLDTVVPTTKGYKTIKTIAVGDEVFDINNKPVKVLGKSEIFTNHKVYRLEFLDQAFHPESMIVISDEIHRFPVIKDTVNYEETMVKDMNIGDYVLDRNANGFQLSKKELIESEPVQCILVDSDSHLFLITDEIDNNWKGGNSYPYKAIYTRNTGGGKAIYIEQEIEIKENKNDINL